MNEQLVNEIVDRLKRDILSNKSFIKSFMKDIKLTKENIDPELILTIMAQTKSLKTPPVPKSNRKMETAEKEGKTCSKPISIDPNGNEPKIVADLLAGNNVYLYGRAGSGKTYIAMAIAECVMQQPVFIINCSQWTSPLDIKGGQTITGYKEGELIKAWSEGGILILDELPKLDPNTAGLLNQALAETATMPKYTEDGKVIEGTIPYIVNGRGEKIYRGQNALDKETQFRFGVIGTGNTDMKSVTNQYSGNQRQDYSLVDRFAGSYYKIDYDYSKEMSLTYSYVFNVANSIREFLDKEPDSVESISLRTMLNFNRTYEQYMLYKVGSFYADKIFDNEGNEVPPKNLEDSINSFIDTLPIDKAERLRNYDSFRSAVDNSLSENEFMIEFKKRYHKDPATGNDLTEQQVQELLK